MSRILRVYDRSIFELTPNFLGVNFPFAQGFASNHGSVDATMNDRVNDRVNDTQKNIILMMEENPKITAKELAVKLKITERNIRNNIRNLRESGFVGRVGSDKTGYWEVIK